MIIVLFIIGGLFFRKPSRFIHKAQSDIKTFKITIEYYNQKYGHYPSQEVGLRGILEFIKNMDKEKILYDPWGNLYQYNIPGPNGLLYEVFTYGADEKPGGTGDNRDVKSSDFK